MPKYFNVVTETIQNTETTCSHLYRTQLPLLFIHYGLKIEVFKFSLYFLPLGFGGAVYSNFASKRHETVFLVRFGRVECRVVTASFSKWPSEPISTVFRLDKKPLVSRSLVSAV